MTKAIALVLLAALPVAAQRAGDSSTLAQPQASAGAAATTAKKSDQAALSSEQYSDAVANALLSRIAGGFTRRNPKLLLSAFDAQHFDGYSLFSERMRARLGQHDSFRTYFRILDTAVQESRAIVNVEFQIEQTSAATGGPPTRNTGQARFTLERGAAGWRVVDVAPRELLTGIHGPA